MAYPRILTIALCTLATPLATMGCKERPAQQAPISVSAPEGNAGPPELIMKSYAVPNGQVQQVRSVLTSTFNGLRDHAPARAEASPDGQLLVVGSPGIHRGVEEFLARMANLETPPPPPTVEIEYWFVVARPAQENTFGPGLKPITPALQAVAEAQGAMRFDKLESTRLSTVNNEKGKADGRYSHVAQRVSVHGQKVIADVRLELRTGARLETRLTLNPGGFTVLGETGVSLEKLELEWAMGSGPYTLFYVARATVDNDI